MGSRGHVCLISWGIGLGFSHGGPQGPGKAQPSLKLVPHSLEDGDTDFPSPREERPSHTVKGLLAGRASTVVIFAVYHEG